MQKAIAKELMSAVDYAPKRVLDLGCGEGAIWRQISWNVDLFVAVDAAASMIKLHPSGDNVRKEPIDFNDAIALARLAVFSPFDLIASSCSLQWADDLGKTLEAIAPFGGKIAFALFTDKTLETLRDLSGAQTPLLSYQAASEIISRYFDARFWRKSYLLEFVSKREMFSYIRKSGIGGGKAKLSVAETKRLIANYPNAKLEYETLFAIGGF
jgi:malonyl-CoA O-methyltransferase